MCVFLFCGFGLNYKVDEPKGLVISFKNKKTNDDYYNAVAFRAKVKEAKNIDLVNVLCPDVSKKVVFNGDSFSVGEETDQNPILGTVTLVVVPRSTRFTFELEDEEVFIEGEWQSVANFKWKTWLYKGQQRNEVFF